MSAPPPARSTIPPWVRIGVLCAVALLCAALLGGPDARSAHGASPARQPDRAAPVLRQAQRLATDWGRCPTARPAHRLLAIARRTRAATPRLARARRALGAWRQVVVDCSKPQPLPQVVVGESAFVPGGG